MPSPLYILHNIEMLFVRKPLYIVRDLAWYEQRCCAVAQLWTQYKLHSSWCYGSMDPTFGHLMTRKPCTLCPLLQLEQSQQCGEDDNWPGPVFCPLLRVSSGCDRPITGQVTSVTWPVIGWALSELTPSKRQKMGLAHSLFQTVWDHNPLLGNFFIQDPLLPF